MLHFAFCDTFLIELAFTLKIVVLIHSNSSHLMHSIFNLVLKALYFLTCLLVLKGSKCQSQQTLNVSIFSAIFLAVASHAEVSGVFLLND